MLGRAARKKEEEAIVHVIQQPKLFDFHLKKLNQTQNESTEVAELMKNSLLKLHNCLIEPQCTWKGLLSYFNEHDQDDWTCLEKCNKCNHQEEDPLDNPLVDLPTLRKALQMVSSIPELSKTTFYHLMIGTPSALAKVPSNILELVPQRSGKRSGISSISKASDFVRRLLNEGLISIALPKGRHGVILELTDKGKQTLENSTLMEATQTDICSLPTEDILNETPLTNQQFTMPNQDIYEKINSAEEMTDELMEICLQTIVVRGSIVLDVTEKDRLICIPLEMFSELFCEKHKAFKQNYQVALKPFHKWPKYVSWHIMQKWKGESTFVENTKGLNIKFYCGHKQFNCSAQKQWKSIRTVKHNGNEHVLIHETFVHLGGESKAILNRHLHAAGAKVSRPKTATATATENNCCIYNEEAISTQFKELIKNEKLPMKTKSQPVFSYMEQLLQGYVDDPLAAQLNPSITYSKARNEMHQQKQTMRPWLQGANLKGLSNFNRVQLLKKYLDKEGQEKNRSSRPQACPFYIGPATLHDGDAFTVICTDLFGITMFNLCAKNGVCSIDGTGEIEGRINLIVLVFNHGEIFQY